MKTKKAESVNKLEIKLKELRRKNRVLSKELKEVTLNRDKLHHFCLDYQMYIHALLCKNKIFMAFQQMRRAAYTLRVIKGETPIWGESSYIVKSFENLDSYNEQIIKLEKEVLKWKELYHVRNNRVGEQHLEIQKLKKELKR